MTKKKTEGGGRKAFLEEKLSDLEARIKNVKAELRALTK